MLNPETAPAGEEAGIPPAIAARLQELDQIIQKKDARIRQLKSEIETRQDENDQIIAENLKQNEELTLLNVDLDRKVQERTSDLAASKALLETQNRQLEDLSAAKEAMTHMLVHDLKNPLCVVLGHLKLLGHPSMNLSPMGHQSAQDALQQAQRLLDMIEDILTISRMKSGAFEPAVKPEDLVDLVGRCVRLMDQTQKKNLNLLYTPPVPAGVVSLDAHLIERVVNNLINNAIKYAPAGSALTIEARLGEAEAEVTVSNLGKPIPESFHASIFEMFFRTEGSNCAEVKGTGLGLAFCKLAVEAHHGRIGVTSPLPGHDVGCRFWFTLPRAGLTH